MNTARLDHFAAHGTGWDRARIRLADSHVIIVQAGPGAFGIPRPTSPFMVGAVPTGYPGPYTHFELTLLSGLQATGDWIQIEEFIDRDGPDASHFLEVPVEDIRALVLAHGGEHAEQDEPTTPQER